MADVVEMPKRPRGCIDHPDVEPEVGFGLAGGGYGAYTYCPECSRILDKTYENEGVRVTGVARDAQNARCLSVVFSDALNDDDMRSFHDYVREWKK